MYKLKEKKKKTFIFTTYLYSNIWFLFVLIIYLNSNTSIIFIKKNTKLLLPKNVKRIILSHIQNGKKKKNYYSHHPFVFKCLIPIYICYLFVFKYFNYLYKKNTKLLLKKKKKKATTSCKNYSFLSWNFKIFFLILQNIPQFLLSKFYTVIINPPSIHTNIYYLSFV